MHLGLPHAVAALATSSALAALVMACGPAQPPPKQYNVQIIGAVIAPSESNGQFWDGDGQIPQDEKDKFIQALSSVDPYAGVVALLGDAVLAGTIAPDPYGSAELAQGGTYQPNLTFNFFKDRDSNFEDTYQPTFPLPNGWNTINIDDGTRVRVTLIDEDLTNDDPIGVAEIGSAELLAAAKEGKVHHVRVDDQTHGQLYFVDISVQEIKQ